MTAPVSGTVVTLVAGHGAYLSEALARNVVSSVKAHHLEWLHKHHAADLFTNESDIADLARCARAALGDEPIDLFVQPVASRRKKLLIADMESTIIEQEMLDELAEMIGVGAKVAAITRRAMNGEIDFAAALKERVQLLRGQPAGLLGEAAKRITHSHGAEQLIAGMKRAGAQCWLVSGGFTFFVKPVAQKLGFDRFYCNELEVKDDLITGHIPGSILDKDDKRRILEEACAELNITLCETASIGDGANDVPMLEACGQGGGLGVAFHAKPKVRAAIPMQINYSDLTALLYAQGIISSSRA